MVTMEGFSFADMWFPVDDTFDPGEADHYILGIKYDNQKSFSVNIEGYYKDYNNIAEYRFKAAEKQGADTDWNNMTGDEFFLDGKGYSYGADLYIRNNYHGFEGWIGYSLNWLKKKVLGYNFDQYYYPTFDRRHTITAIQDYRLSRKWRLNFAFKYGSGQPYSETTARYTSMNPNGSLFYVELKGEKNSYRLPDYHRLDVGVFYSTKIFGADSEIYVQVVNVYNNKNIFFRYYDFESNPAKRKDFNMLPLIPTFGFSVHF